MRNLPFYKDNVLEIDVSLSKSEETEEEAEVGVIPLDAYIDLEKNKEYILVAGDQSSKGSFLSSPS